MKYNIVFSIPIHEKFEVVLDQIINFFHFNPHCAIVYHISQGFNYKTSQLSREEFNKAIDKIGNVYINPESVRTGGADIIQAHLSNFKYITSVADFDYFSMCSSNELFIKTGLIEYVNDNDCGIEFLDVISKKDSEWESGLKGLNDNELKGYLSRYGVDKFYGSHVEGSFYRKDLFLEIVCEIESFYDYLKMTFAYPREEVYFSTVAWIINQKKHKLKILENGLFSWSRWHSLLDLKIWVWDIGRLEKQIGVYSVKRVDRDINANLRMYIRNLYGYEAEEKKYYQGLRTRGLIMSYMMDFLDYILENLKKIYRVIRILYRRSIGYYEREKWYNK